MSKFFVFAVLLAVFITVQANRFILAEIDKFHCIALYSNDDLDKAVLCKQIRSCVGAPLSPYDEIVEAATAGEWEKLQSLLAKQFAKDGWKELSSSSVKDLKPPKGGHVYGEAEYTFHSQSDYNGQRSEKSGGHKIINEDGKVQEFDFKPSIEQEDLFKKFGLKPVEQS